MLTPGSVHEVAPKGANRGLNGDIVQQMGIAKTAVLMLIPNVNSSPVHQFPQSLNIRKPLGLCHVYPGLYFILDSPPERCEDIPPRTDGFVARRNLP